MGLLYYQFERRYADKGKISNRLTDVIVKHFKARMKGNRDQGRPNTTAPRFIVLQGVGALARQLRRPRSALCHDTYTFKNLHPAIEDRSGLKQCAFVQPDG